MKKIFLLLIVLLVGCTSTQEIPSVIDCEKFPSATECVKEEEPSKPIIIPDKVIDKEPDTEPEPVIEPEPISEPEPVPYNVCDDYPGHAECIEPLDSFQVYTYENGQEYFNSSFNMKLYIGPEQNGHDYYSIYETLGEKYHKLSDKYDNYDGYINIKTINDNPTETHYLEEELYDLIKFSITNYEVSKGYFDISIGPITSIWHYYRDRCTDHYNQVAALCTLPPEEELLVANENVDFAKIVLDDELMSITMEEGMSLDLGGIAKGYFVEILANEFMQRGLRAFIINAGGNIKTYGNKPEEDFYKLYIQDPNEVRGEGKLPFTLYIPGGYSLVSSGDQVNFYLVDGEVYHHIINPYTMYPDRYSRQVTIITNDSRAADILSTSVYLMTLEDGLEFVDSLENVEAIWYGLDDEIYYSKNALDFLTFDE